MRIALFHGYELTGSGSNEFNRYLARALAREGHSVELVCREPEPAHLPFVAAAWRWEEGGASELLFEREVEGQAGFVRVHVLPHAAVRPVFVKDKVRAGNVKTFCELEESEREEYHRVTAEALAAILAKVEVDVLMANHLAYQPIAAAEVCERAGVPMVVFPHGSAIEYTIRHEERYQRLVGEALARASGMIAGSHEMLERIEGLFAPRGCSVPAARVVGVGVDTELFVPVPRRGRTAAIANLAESGPFRGKHPAQGLAMRARLDEGELEALEGWRGAYDAREPDVDAAERLTALPWTSGKVLLFVGALTVGKGLQSLIAALPRVLAEEPDAHLVIVGSGAYREVLEAFVHALASGNAPLLEYLVHHGCDLEKTHLSGPWHDVLAELRALGTEGLLASARGLEDHVHFVGRLPHDMLRHVFPCADLAVFPSIVPEAYPLVLMESLANGVLPLASDFSGFAEGLRNLEPFLGRELVDRLRLPVDPEIRVRGIAERLIALLADERSRRPEVLRELAVERYDWQVRARQLVHALAELMHESPLVGAARS